MPDAPGPSIPSTTLGAYKIACTVVAWNTYNMNFLNIQFGIDVRSGDFDPYEYVSENIAKNAVLDYFGKVLKIPSPLVTIIDFFVWEAFEHSSNISQLMRAIATVDDCALTHLSLGEAPMPLGTPQPPFLSLSATMEVDSAPPVLAAASAAQDSQPFEEARYPWVEIIVEKQLLFAEAVVGVANLSASTAPGITIDTLPDAEGGYDHVIGGTVSNDGIEVAIAPGDSGGLVDAGAGGDSITGSEVTDYIFAGSGNDTLIGNGGNDVLSGQSGNDTYVVRSTDGAMIIADRGSVDDVDKILFEDLNLADVTFHIVDEDEAAFFFRIEATGEYSVISNMFQDGDTGHIEVFEFADGHTLTAEEALQLAQVSVLRPDLIAAEEASRSLPVEGDFGPNSLSGTERDDGISGLEGDDTLEGAGGADTLDGGQGNDVINGGADDDILIGGEGDDTITGDGPLPDPIDVPDVTIDASFTLDETGERFGLSTTLVDAVAGTGISLSGNIQTAATTNIAFLVDISGSARDVFPELGIGDRNGNSIENEVIDAEVAAVEALVNSLISEGLSNINARLLPFSSIVDDFQSYRGVIGDDDNSNGVPDIIDAASQLIVGGRTDFTDAFEAARTFFESFPQGARNIVYLLSDGQSSSSDHLPLVDDITRPEGLGAVFNAFGLGGGVDSAQLDAINSIGPATIVTDFSSFQPELLGETITTTPVSGVNILINGALVAEIAVSQMTATDTGYSFDVFLGGLDVDTDDVIDVELRLEGVDDPVGSVSQTVENLSSVTQGNDDIVGGAGNDDLSGQGGDDLIRGGEGDDTVEGGLGDDVLIGGLGADLITGDSGRDELLGGEGDDDLSGGDGDDLLEGGVGADQLDGGDGLDWAIYSNSGSSVEIDLGSGTASGGALGDTLLEIENIRGSSLDDALFGDELANILNGGDGNDTLRGGEGDDIIDGGTGADIVVFDGILADYTINYVSGTATVEDLNPTDGDEGTDLVRNVRILRFSDGDVQFNSPPVIEPSTAAGSVTEIADGAAGENTDTLTATGAVNFYDVDVTDTHTASITSNGLGYRGTFSIVAPTSTNMTTTGAISWMFTVDDADIDDLAAGEVLMQRYDVTVDDGNGGTAVETVSVTITGSDDTPVIVTILGTEVADTIFGTSGSDLIEALEGNDLVYGEAGTDSIAGGDGSDTIYGWIGDDFIQGGRGSDLVTGDGGDDQIYGGSGDDALYGGDGNDFISSGTGSDTVGGDSGNDTIIGQGGDDLLFGGSGDDVLNGRQGNDTLNGGMGIDTTVGGPGSDTHIVDQAGDRVAESRKWDGLDAVISSVDFRMGRSHIENLELVGSASIGAGNGLTNVIIGNDLNNILDGGRNVDTLVGGVGDDIYHLRNPGDMAVEAIGEGTDTIKAFGSFALGSNIEKLYLQRMVTSSGDPVLNLNAIGNGLDNTIVGNTFDNTIVGREGRDTLKGQAGADTFVFDRALTRKNVDRIIDFNTNELGEGDILKVKGSIFGNLATGALDGKFFVAGKAALDADDRFVFDRAEGKLYFDADGSGEATQQLVAKFEQNAIVTAVDIEIF